MLEKEYVPLCYSLVSPDSQNRKEKDVGRVFAKGFTWPEFFDAAADVYNGVCNLIAWRRSDGRILTLTVHFLVHVDCARTLRVV